MTAARSCCLCTDGPRRSSITSILLECIARKVTLLDSIGEWTCKPASMSIASFVVHATCIHRQEEGRGCPCIGTVWVRAIWDGPGCANGRGRRVSPLIGDEIAASTMESVLCDRKIGPDLGKLEQTFVKH